MKKLRIGVAGLGRMGSVHARNIAGRIPNAELTAACTRIPGMEEFALRELGAKYFYTDFSEMIQNPEIDAVAVVSASGDHCAQIEAALDAGKHVFAEKPLGVSIEQCRQAEKAVERHPELTFMLGFMRRFDASYAYAMEKIRAGAIGTPYLVKSTGMDPESTVEETLRYAPGSAGIFMDLGIHDFDLMRWFLKSEPVEVYAIGASFKYPEFKKYNDDEAAVAVLKFANGAMGVTHVGRAAPHGYHVETEIVGTDGSIRISGVPEKNLAMIYDGSGARTECVESFPERFDLAYLNEMEEFVSCALSGRKPEVSVYDGTKSAQIAQAATEAWRTGKSVQIRE